jgi:hypothetical protein
MSSKREGISSLEPAGDVIHTRRSIEIVANKARKVRVGLRLALPEQGGLPELLRGFHDV